MKRIRLTESQYITLIDESMGVPNGTQETAMCIVNTLIEQLDDITTEINELRSEDESEEDDDSWGYFVNNSWEDEFSYDFYLDADRGYCIELFYDSNSRKKADTDTDGGITINFAPIQDIIDNCNERFNVNGINANVNEYINNEIVNYLYPVILHELTHDRDEGGSNNDHIWLGSYHKFNEEDLREILYLFSDNEINARVASAAALMDNSMGDLFVDSEFSNGSEFSEFVNEWVIKDGEKELHLRYMTTLVNSIGLDFNNDKKYISRLQKGETPYSLAYGLFRNDSRLKRNRNLKRLFHQNYVAAREYVVNFYKKKLEQYKKKIIRACWYAYQTKMSKTHENNQA